MKKSECVLEGDMWGIRIQPSLYSLRNQFTAIKLYLRHKKPSSVQLEEQEQERR